ncbi:hypothetical protein ACJ41O_000516 [Fusarium nematophilum]
MNMTTLPVELISLVAEHIAQHLEHPSPFLESTGEAERADWQNRYRDLLKLVVSCRAIYHCTRHLLYARLVLEKPADVVAAFVDVVKNPRVRGSIYHIRCCAELASDAARDRGRLYWLLNHSQDTELVENALQEQALRPPWWEDLADRPEGCWEGLQFSDGLTVALCHIFSMATDVRSLSFSDIDMGWETLTKIAASFNQPRPFLGTIQALQCRLYGRDEWTSLGEFLFQGGYENLRTLVLDGMSLMDMSDWSHGLQVQNTRVEQLYLGPRGRHKPPIPNPRFGRQEWVRGKWLLGGPRLEAYQPEIWRVDNEGWGMSMLQKRRRMENLRGFRHLRLLDVVVYPPPTSPSKTLVALKNIAAELEVFRVEGYPFVVFIPGT